MMPIRVLAGFRPERINRGNVCKAQGCDQIVDVTLTFEARAPLMPEFPMRVPMEFRRNSDGFPIIQNRGKPNKLKPNRATRDGRAIHPHRALRSFFVSSD